MRFNKKLIFVLGAAALLTACKKEEPVETPAPTPEYIESSSAVFTCYGDSIVFTIEGNEAIQSMTDTQIVLLPDRSKFDTVTIDYIQGNSLNDYGAAYYEGLNDSTKSDYTDDSFITSTNVYTFTRTAENRFLMIRGPVSYKDYCISLRDRFR